MSSFVATSAEMPAFSCSILLFSEDHDGVQRRDLAHPGFYVIRTASLREARRLYARHPDIAVVVADMAMPDNGAVQLVQALQRDHPDRDWTEYVLLSHESTSLTESGLDACEVLPHGFARGDLLAAVTSSYNSSRLKQFRRDEVQSLERHLDEFQKLIGGAAAQLLHRVRNPFAGAPTPEAPMPDAAQTGLRLQSLVADEKARVRLQEKVFGKVVQSPASWMLLLVLWEAARAGKEITVKGVAYQAGLPLSSALRRLNEIYVEGLAIKRGDATDGRRSFVELTPLGHSRFERYAQELGSRQEARAAKADNPMAPKAARL